MASPAGLLAGYYLAYKGYRPLIIEREISGPQQIADMKTAIGFLAVGAVFTDGGRTLDKAMGASQASIQIADASRELKVALGHVMLAATTYSVRPSDNSPRTCVSVSASCRSASRHAFRRRRSAGTRRAPAPARARGSRPASPRTR